MNHTRTPLTLALALAVLGVWGCPSAPVAVTRARTSPHPSAVVSAAPGARATQHGGLVVGLDGQPAANVDVRAYIISDQGSQVVSNNGGGLIGQVKTGLINNNSTKWSLLQTDPAPPLETHTDAQGRFTLTFPDAQPRNLEAVQADTVKAFAGSVVSVDDTLTMKLAHTGSISGRVTAPDAPSVTDFEGVQVFIPGSSYVALTDQHGNYQLSNVPVGAFTLVGLKSELGRGSVDGVVVKSDANTPAPDIKMAIAVPTIRSLSPNVGAPGSKLTITGDNFGAADNKSLQITVGGAVADPPTRTNNNTLEFTVPPSATSGNVVVSVGGVESSGTPFTLATSLALQGETGLLVSDQPRYTAVVKDKDGRVLTGADVAWSVTGSNVSVDATGKLTATATGKATLHAAVGTLTADLPIEVFTSFTDVSTLALQGTVPAGFAPGALALDGKGHLYVADTKANTIYTITLAGEGGPQIAILAGTADAGGTDGPAASAKFNAPAGLALDTQGHLLVADGGNGRIREIDLANPTGPTVSTIAGTTPATPPPPTGNFGMSQGPIFQDGPGATATFQRPGALAVMADGSLMVGDEVFVRRIDLAGAAHTVSTAISNTAFGSYGNSIVPGTYNGNICALVPAADGSLYVAVSTFLGPASTQLYLVPAGGTAKNILSGASTPSYPAMGGLALDPAGGLYATFNTFINTLGHIGADGSQTIVAGPTPTGDPSKDLATRGHVDGPAVQAEFSGPVGIVRDADGTLYIADDNSVSGSGCIRKVVSRGAKP